MTTFLWRLYSSTCISRHPQLTTILLEQSFYACIPLLMATRAIGLARRRQSSHQQCYVHHLRTLIQLKTIINQLTGRINTFSIFYILAVKQAIFIVLLLHSLLQLPYHVVNRNLDTLCCLFAHF